MVMQTLIGLLISIRENGQQDVFYIGKSVISWCSKRQSVVALSTAEAEYISLSKTTTEAIWLPQLFPDLGFTQNKSTIIYEDNQSSIAIASDGKFQS